jgi:predicted nucleic acid-binding protein
MTVILDTNVVSELMKASPRPRVMSWLGAQPRRAVFISAITEAELRVGVALLPAGRRRDGLAAEVETMIAEDFSGRVAPFDSPAAKAFAEIVADRRRSGRPISTADAQIAAIARSRGVSLATRNVRDFQGCGVDVIDPWADPA